MWLLLAIEVENINIILKGTIIYVFTVKLVVKPELLRLRMIQTNGSNLN